MKQALITLSILMSCMMAQAAPITTEKAKENALAYLASGKMQRVKGNHNLKLVYSRNDPRDMKTPLFHVFNIDEGNGFIIASADDVAVPVLGYCDKGAFNPDNIPDNMQAWLDGYGEEISKARENGFTQKEDVPIRVSRQMINPMVKSTWAQSEPYNDLCVFNGTRCLTGCLATAMAQLLYYWATTGIDGKKYKCGCTALASYTTRKHGYAVDALDSLTTFDWDSMTDGKPTTEKGKAAVAQLMRYCGQSIKMDYDVDGSGASMEYVTQALQNNFEYNYNIELIYSKDMSTEEWDEMVYQELAGGKPFLISGGGFPGHAFICDGYDPSTGAFHFNWGWSGYLDGWFAMTSLTPGSHNYTSQKNGIKGVQPFDNPYFVLSADGKTLTFYYDDKKIERNGTIYHLDRKREWKTVVEYVIFDSNMSNTHPNVIYWFNGMSNLKDITGLEYLDTSNVKSMANMFSSCSNLTILDLSHFDTSKVTNMSYMFDRCSSLESIDLGNFDTSKVTNMKSMFNSCSTLTNLDVSHFDTSNVTDIEKMFYNCRSLESLDLSNFDTSNVTSMETMFYDCSKLKSLNLSHFNTLEVTKMKSMFMGCNSLERLDLSSFVTPKVTDMYGMFYNCTHLKSLDVSHFDTSNVTSFKYMFYYCTSLTNLDLSNFHTSNLTDMYSMFYNCRSLENLDVSHFDTSNVTKMGLLFSDCNSLLSLDISNFDMGNATDLLWILSDCTSLHDLYIPASLPELDEWGCLRVGTGAYPCTLHVPEGFFLNVDTLATRFKWYGGYFYLAGTTVPYAILMDSTRMEFHFDDHPWERSLENTIVYDLPKTGSPRWLDRTTPTKITSVEISRDFVNTRPINMCSWFCSMDKIVTISGLEYLNTSEVTNMADMFYGCDKLEEIDVSHFNTAKVEKMSNMFNGCFKLKSLDIGNFDMSNVNSCSDMAAYCRNLQFLRLAPGMEALDDNSFYGVKNKEEPCQLVAPEGFDFGFTPPANEDFKWKGGWFILVDDFAIGDVNHDRQVNITDVTLMVDHVLGNQPKNFHRGYADINHDGQVNITDVSLIVKSMLGSL